MAMCAVWLAPLSAEEFRIETQVFVDDQTEPVDEKLTLFDRGIVYHFHSDPPQVCVFKESSGASPGRFVLLDSARRLRTELKTDEIRDFMKQLKVSAASQSDPIVRFAADPHFDESYVDEPDGTGGELTLESDVLHYRIVTQKAKDRLHLDRYREFSDWNAQLTTMLNVGSTPPFPRLAVNAAIAEREVLAREVHLTISARRPYREDEVSIHAVHLIHWRLSKEDRQQIDRVASDLVTFKPVKFSEYRRR